MPSHKKFDDSSDEGETTQDKRKEESGNKQRSKEARSADKRATSSRDREKRREHESRRNRDDEHRSDRHRDRSSERYDDARNERRKNEGRREHRPNRSRYQNFEGDDRDEPERREKWRNDKKRTDRPRREREEEDSVNAGEPAWATNRVKEHAEKLKERKLLWQGKKDEPEAEGGEASVVGVDQQAAKNMGMWSSAIAATGVDNKQAEKFKRLMGFKGNTAQNPPETDDASLIAEREKQKNLVSSLNRQFEIARGATHTGRGLGLGFH